MKRLVHSDADNLDWKVRRVWLPEALRPIGVRQIHSGSVRPHQYAGLGVIISPLFTLVFGLPVMLVLLPLRFAGIAAWEVEAIARPWGRRGPPRIMRWRA